MEQQQKKNLAPEDFEETRVTLSNWTNQQIARLFSNYPHILRSTG